MSRLLPLLLVPALALFLADRAAAQAEPTERAPTELDSPSPLPAIEEPGIPLDNPGDPVARGFFGPLAGLGLFAGSTALGTLIGFGVMSGCNADEEEGEGGLRSLAGLVFGAIAGASAGLALLYPLGVVLGAGAAGGRGDVGWTYLGGLIGAAVGTGIFFVGLGIQQATRVDWDAVMIPAIVLGAGAALVGPVIAYEITDRAARTSARTETSWLPTLTVGPHGASAGVVGSF